MSEIKKRGRKKGPSERTKRWLALGEAIENQHTDRFNRILSHLDDEKFLDAYLKILQYFRPRLQSVKADIDSKGVVINIVSDDKNIMNDV